MFVDWDERTFESIYINIPVGISLLLKYTHVLQCRYNARFILFTSIFLYVYLYYTTIHMLFYFNTILVCIYQHQWPSTYVFTTQVQTCLSFRKYKCFLPFGYSARLCISPSISLSVYRYYLSIRVLFYFDTMLV